MAKTRSQVSYPQVKKEEREDKPKLERLLHITKKNTSNNKNKITKNKASKTKPIQAHIVTVKSENTDDSKEILALPLRTLRRSNITKEQIAELIGFIVNDKMNVHAAARKARMSYPTARIYYQQYQDYPEHRIPLPRKHSNMQSSKLTQKKIEDLINYIVYDKMTLAHAAYKAIMSIPTAYKYYKKYMEDPDHKIPTLDIRGRYLYKFYTQEEVNDLISYIVNSNMSVAAAAKKVNMATYAAKRFYLKYLEDPNHKIPTPGKFNINNNQGCTNEQVKSLIGYIVDDEMTIMEASVKANLSDYTVRKYYRQYLDDPNHNIPTPETDNEHSSKKRPTLDQIRNVFSFIIIDKLNIKEASLKANIPRSTGYRYCKKYLKKLTKEVKIVDNSYSVEKIKKLVEYIQNDKMSIKSAAINTNLCYDTALKYYRQYLKDPQNGFPMAQRKRYTQEEIKRLIGYIENDNMNVKSAAKAIKMNVSNARKYYNKYRNDPEHKIPVPVVRGYYQRRKAIDKYSQIIADIYKNNPSIRPMREIHSHSDLSLPDINVKLELLDDNTKMISKDEK